MKRIKGDFNQKGSHKFYYQPVGSKELYEFKRFTNVKLTNVINQIPMEIDYVLREQRKYREAVNNGLTTRKERINSSCEDREHVA